MRAARSSTLVRPAASRPSNELDISSSSETRVCPRIQGTISLLLPVTQHERIPRRVPPTIRTCISQLQSTTPLTSHQNSVILSAPRLLASHAFRDIQAVSWMPYPPSRGNSNVSYSDRGWRRHHPYSSNMNYDNHAGSERRPEHANHRHDDTNFFQRRVRPDSYNNSYAPHQNSYQREFDASSSYNRGETWEPARYHPISNAFASFQSETSRRRPSQPSLYHPQSSGHLNSEISPSPRSAPSRNPCARSSPRERIPSRTFVPGRSSTPPATISFAGRLGALRDPSAPKSQSQPPRALASLVTTAEPSAAYLKISKSPSVRLASPNSQRKLVILDLNGTLLVRSSRRQRQQEHVGEESTGQPPPRRAFPRPYLPALHAYLVHPFVREWLDTMVWSSAQPHSVDDMVRCAFGDTAKLDGTFKAVWARDMFGLERDAYCQCISVPFRTDFSQSAL